MEESTSEDKPPHQRLIKGCILCHQGAKLVLFITGLCKRDCWYCPLSSDRKNRDRIFANEHEITTPSDCIAVAERMSALGTGITGGEPFLVPERLVLYATRLKERFGKEHHIHLYSGIAPDQEQLQIIKGIVDEIRLHPPQEHWEHIRESPYYHSVLAARDMGFTAGFEVPSLPGLDHLAIVCDDLDLCNINELEWGESNADHMRRKGYEPADSCHNAVKGAYLHAETIKDLPNVHFCSSEFKDSVQLRNRLLRIAHNTARPFDEITGDGTVIYGVLETNSSQPQLNDVIDPELYMIFDDRVEMAWWILEENASTLPGKKYIIERYPDEGTVMEVTPL
ncbi:MAG: radical SAM protein [Methanospirillaceae archaeon]|nr:radical SAM protein [Methanospirillaceae archaeon]